MKRFWAKVRKTTGCWLWTASKYAAGYGMFNLDGKPEGSHRIAYRLRKGPIPEGMYVLHRCDNRACVRPAHLFLGTAKDNMDDMTRKGRRYSGDGHHAAKINWVIAQEIRRRVANGELQKIVAQQLWVSKGIVSEVVLARTWNSCANKAA